MISHDSRLIERGFPCHQVGAETIRERDTGKAPPTHRLHVWWARRPLTPSRAAVLASLLPADTDPEHFVRSLGIEKRVAEVNGTHWTLTGKLLDRVQSDGQHEECLPVDDVVLRALNKEQERRKENLKIMARLKSEDTSLAHDPVLVRWEQESQPIAEPWPPKGLVLQVRRKMGDPAWAKGKLIFTKKHKVYFQGDAYGYDRAFSKPALPVKNTDLTILDPTSGGGSIPFEALRLGYKVIANELNPVAAVVLYATLVYPIQYNVNLLNSIKKYGELLLEKADHNLFNFYPDNQYLPETEASHLKKAITTCYDFFDQFNKEEIVDFLYCRQVTCPHCLGEAPLLNSCWLSKEDNKQWGVKVIADGKNRNGTVRFKTYKVSKGTGPNGEDPDFATVNRGVGHCVHCKQAIAGDEIKAQARGESRFGQWRDRLYCVVANRYEPMLDKNGLPERYASGEKKGQIKTKKLRFFRPANEQDLKALDLAKAKLKEKWDEWAAKDFIPTEKIPEGHKTGEPMRYGMNRWCDMFTPRQLLGHVTLVEALNTLKPKILEELGEERGRAVITYLQFAIDKGVDYNSRQTRWEYTRGVVKGNFGRHDFSLKWTFGEMIFTGPNSGAAWGLSQVLDAYSGMAELLTPVHTTNTETDHRVKIYNGSASHIAEVQDGSIDCICMDPPYYNNVQYAELSDYFYVWHKRTLKDLYPGLYNRRMTNKMAEAVANPARDGSDKAAKATYEKLMAEIFSESKRVLKKKGLMTLMFTHKSQDAWETLLRSLIDSGWKITATFPVESESSASMHQVNMAAAASSIFISCRKREANHDGSPAMWTGLGGQGVQKEIESSVREGLLEFEPLKLNPVDEMVASYGRALKVLSENWPVMDKDEEVSPIKAMNEASRVVAENQITRLTKGRLQVADLDSETAMALTLYGIWGLNELAYDEALNLSRSLNISLTAKNGGYQVEDQSIGINTQTSGRSRQRQESNTSFHAPLIRNGSKLRLARPQERHEKRLNNPQTDWDILQGMLVAYAHGDIPVVRPYLEKYAPNHSQRILDLLQVWTAEMDDEDMKQKGEMLLFGLGG